MSGSELPLTRLDDYPWHQTTEPFPLPSTSDTHFNDGYYFGFYGERCFVYLQLGQYEKALADCSKGIELNEKVSGFWERRGSAYAALGDPDKAVADYSKAIELDPKNVAAINALAWLLATCPEPKVRDPRRAVEAAKKAVQLAPTKGEYWSTLGAAHYRAGAWKAAVEALMKSVQLRKGGASFEFFFLALAHWQLGEKDKARTWYDRAVAWMDQNSPQNEELKRFRAEATALLGLAKVAQTQNKKD